MIPLCLYIYSFFFRFSSHIGYYRILNRVPCAIQLTLVGYFIYSSQHYIVVCMITPFAATWMDLEIIILSEVSQTEKHKYHVISLICGI